MNHFIFPSFPCTKFSVLLSMLASGIALECVVPVPTQFAHALLGRIVRPGDPLFQIVKLFLMLSALREICKQSYLLALRQPCEHAPKSLLRLIVNGRKSGGKLPLMFSSIDAQQ